VGSEMCIRDRAFFLANGNGRNGKGVINELFAELLGPDYFYKLPVDVLTSKKDLSSGANPQLANMHKKRFILSAEPDTDDGSCDKLRMARIKDLTGGKEFNARKLYVDDCKVKMNQVQMLECNQKPKISGKIDTSVIERVYEIPFVCTYTKHEYEVDHKNNIFIVNTDYKTSAWQKKHKHALFKYLLDVAPAKIYLPKIIIEASREYVFGSDAFIVWFKENYEKTENDKDIVKIKDLFDDLKESEIYNNFTKEEKRNLTKKKLIENIASSPLLKEHYFNDSKTINKVKYNERINFYKKKDKNTEEDSEDEEEETGL